MRLICYDIVMGRNVADTVWSDNITDDITSKELYHVMNFQIRLGKVYDDSANIEYDYDITNKMETFHRNGVIRIFTSFSQKWTVEINGKEWDGKMIVDNVAEFMITLHDYHVENVLSRV